MKINFKLLLIIICALALPLTGCLQQESSPTPIPTNTSTPVPLPAPTLGGVFDHFMIINPGETKSTTYTFFSGGEEGNSSLTIYSVSSLFNTDRKEMPEGVNISIKPSQFTVKPDGTYRSNITVETDSDVPGVHDGDSMSWETIVLLIQARVNGKVIEDWYRVYIDPKTDMVVPSLLHLRREASPKLEHNESVVIDRGDKTSVNLTIRTLKTPGTVNISAYEVGELKNGLDVTIKPAYHLPPDSMSWNESKIIIDATRASQGNHTLCIILHHQSGILDVSWLKVNVVG